MLPPFSDPATHSACFDHPCIVPAHSPCNSVISKRREKHFNFSTFIFKTQNKLGGSAIERAHRIRVCKNRTDLMPSGN